METGGQVYVCVVRELLHGSILIDTHSMTEVVVLSFFIGVPFLEIRVRLISVTSLHIWLSINFYLHSFSWWLSVGWQDVLEETTSFVVTHWCSLSFVFSFGRHVYSSFLLDILYYY
jgi:hypothetical protein